MPKEQDGSGLLSASDQAIYQYLDEMLNDSLEESGDCSFQNSPKKGPEPQAALKAQIPIPKPAFQEKTQKPEAKPLKLKEKPETKILTAGDTLQAEPETLTRDTMLGFEKPIVVQQPPVKEKPAEPVVESKVQTKADIEPKGETKVETKVEIIAEPQQAPAPVVEQEPTKDSTVDLDTIMGVIEDKEKRLPPITPWCDNGRPEWAQSRFECLLFKVGGLKLAVPLVTLGQIHPIERKLNHLPGQMDWFIGILQTNIGNIKVMDTALCVMPEKYDPKSREDLEYVITIHGFEWGISCHEILKSITLEPEDVKWRTQRGKRPWLAGTVVDQMCALVDTAGFHHVIQKVEHRD